MELLLLSLLAGTLTVLSPCVLSLIPVLIGGSAKAGNWRRPLVMITSLMVAIVIFTLLLRVSVAFISVPTKFWEVFTGIAVGFYGATLMFPHVWDQIAVSIGFTNSSREALTKAGAKEGLIGDVLLGMSLGPVFTSCSPTYLLLVSTVFQQNFAHAFVSLLAYCLGLALALLPVVFLGKSFINRFKWSIDPDSKFRRGLGVVFVILGFMFIFGLFKEIETILVEADLFNTIEFEQNLVEETTRE